MNSEMIEAVAKTLARRKFQNVMNSWDACSPNMKADFREDARAVIETIQSFGSVEWAIQMQTFIDGDFDNTYTKDSLYNKPFTEEQAKTHSWLNPKAPVPARVVSRLVFDWEAIND